MSKSNPCLYSKLEGAIRTYIFLYVDKINRIEHIGKEFQLTCSHLGVDVEHDSNGVFHIDQRTYIAKILS